MIEVLITIGLFSVIAVGFYSVMFSGINSGDTTEAVVNISSEARSGFNRMVRDTREAQRIIPLSPPGEAYRVLIDFDDDTFFLNPNLEGDFEDLVFRCVGCSPGPGRITLNNETLMGGVIQQGARPVFAFASNLLEYDWDNDGVTSCLELDQAASHGVVGVGNGNNACDGGEQLFLSNVTFALSVRDDGRTTDFFAQAQLRNRR